MQVIFKCCKINSTEIISNIKLKYISVTMAACNICTRVFFTAKKFFHILFQIEHKKGNYNADEAE